MIKLLAQKIGMTSIFVKDGKITAATVLKVPEQSVVGEIISPPGIRKFQIGAKLKERINRPTEGRLKKLGAKITASRFFETEGESFEPNLPQKAELISTGDLVSIKGTSKGKGFQGTVKRHGFHRGPKTHGSDNYRRPGSIGSAYPERVVKGKKMAGRMGNRRVSVKGIRVLRVIPEEQVIVVAGAVPGPNKSYSFILKDEER